MTVEAEVQTMKIGDRVDLMTVDTSNNPGTVMQIEGRSAVVVWDSNIGGDAEFMIRNSTRYTIREIRALRDEELRGHPIPAPVVEHLTKIGAYVQPAQQIPSDSIVVKQAEWEQRGVDIQTLRDRLNGADREFERFKEQVVEAAVEATTEHGWCSEIKSIIADLGLEWPDQTKQIEFDVEITVHVTATLSGANADHADDASWVRSCLSVDEDGQITHDSDLDDVSFSASGHRIENLEEA